MSTLEEPWWPVEFHIVDGEPEAPWHTDDFMIGAGVYSVMRNDGNGYDGDLYTVFRVNPEVSGWERSKIIAFHLDGLVELRCFLLELAYPGSKS